MKRRQPQPAGANILHEQAEFDDFIEKFNHSWFCLLFARLKRRWWRDRTSMIGNVSWTEVPAIRFIVQRRWRKRVPGTQISNLFVPPSETSLMPTTRRK
jgi:hypothetical protein